GSARAEGGARAGAAALPAAAGRRAGVTPREYLGSLELFGIKLGLDQMRALVAALDHPDRTFRSLVIAGTNGKGSVTAMVERALRAAGWRTGRYVSPHLVQVEERVA